MVRLNLYQAQRKHNPAMTTWTLGGQRAGMKGPQSTVNKNTQCNSNLLERTSVGSQGRRSSGKEDTMEPFGAPVWKNAATSYGDYHRLSQLQLQPSRPQFKSNSPSLCMKVCNYYQKVYFK